MGEVGAGSYLADPTSPIPSHCASIVATSTLRVNMAYHKIGSIVMVQYASKPDSSAPLYGSSCKTSFHKSVALVY